MSQRKTPWIHGPGPKVKKVLDAALNYVKSVPYPVSLRWVFYRLYQDGFYSSKTGYDNFEFQASKARHTLWNGWDPDTLADETRQVITGTFGLPNEEEAVEEIKERIAEAADVSFDHFCYQDRYIELWFEARAMAGQFEHYTNGIDLIPMGGQPSIPFKWELAKRLEEASEKYGKEIIILYFGDEDLAGHAIEKDIVEDVANWSSASFELVRCGLTKAQAKKYGIPESIEKKGYQWEALPDLAASEIIKAAVKKYIDPNVIYTCAMKAQLFQKEWQKKIDQILEALE